MRLQRPAPATVLLLVLSGLLGSFAAAAPASAQSLWGVVGTAGQVHAMSGGSGGPCNYPSTHPGGLIVFTQDAVCPGPTPQEFDGGLGLGGDIAIDRQGNKLFVTDGVAIAAYDMGTGHLLGNFTAMSLGLLPPITGLGWDGTNRWLWICNGQSYGAVEPNGTCSPSPRVSAIPAPSILGMLTDIDRDAKTGDLWVCDDEGHVAYFPVAASLPTGLMHVSGPLPGCGNPLDDTLRGLALDPTQDLPVFNVTDGSNAARLVSAAPSLAVAAPPTFAQPQTCWEISEVTLQGLAFAARSVKYGVTNAFVFLDTNGQSTLPSPDFRFHVTGGGTGQVFLVYDFAAACPAGSFGGYPLLLPMSSVSGVIGPIGYDGDLVIHAPLPAAPELPYGVAVFAQAFQKEAATGAWASTRGVSFTFCRP